MAKATGLSVSSVQRIWRAHGLHPHRMRQFKLSNDPRFIAKLRDAVVGLYVDPPAHAIVLSVDEKSQIQALDRTQPGLPLKKDRAGTMTHDYERHGTTTLFAAMNVLDGTVIGRNMQRHRHQEFIRFLNIIEQQVPAGKTIHAIVDNYAAHSRSVQQRQHLHVTDPFLRASPSENSSLLRDAERQFLHRFEIEPRVLVGVAARDRGNTLHEVGDASTGCLGAVNCRYQATRHGRHNLPVDILPRRRRDGLVSRVAAGL
jgi:hypothetical protein